MYKFIHIYDKPSGGLTIFSFSGICTEPLLDCRMPTVKFNIEELPIHILLGI